MSALLSSASAPQGRDVIRVALGERSYDIVVGRGLSAEVGALVRSMGVQRVAIVTDENVDRFVVPAVDASLAEAELRSTRIVVPAGEGSKSFGQLADTCDGLLSAKLDRNDLLLAVGGGVVGDLAGFAAAIVLRGIRFVQIPTSLLAQVDSSVGGKTGINTPRGKNLVGAFHQPSLVLADTATLDTLPPRELRAGYAEVAKYGLIDDAAFFSWCETHVGRILDGGPEREQAVAASCRAKAAVVARDERESGDRALLNLGHTFGHALERIVGYEGSRLVHGEAVAIGICLAFRFSARLGLCPPEDAERVARHYASAGLPTLIGDVPGWNAREPDILAAMAQDKKVRAGRLTFILARGIGRSFVATDVEEAHLRDFLTDELQRT